MWSHTRLFLNRSSEHASMALLSNLFLALDMVVAKDFHTHGLRYLYKPLLLLQIKLFLSPLLLVVSSYALFSDNSSYFTVTYEKRISSLGPWSFIEDEAEEMEDEICVCIKDLF